MLCRICGFNGDWNYDYVLTYVRVYSINSSDDCSNPTIDTEVDTTTVRFDSCPDCGFTIRAKDGS